VNAPRSWPNSSLASRLDDSAPQSIVTSGEPPRSDRAWSASATRSLPVPDSPTISTDVGVAATRSMSANSRSICGDTAIMPASSLRAPPCGTGTAFRTASSNRIVVPPSRSGVPGGTNARSIRTPPM
jgi:hypothetical protein